MDFGAKLTEDELHFLDGVYTLAEATKVQLPPNLNIRIDNKIIDVHDMVDGVISGNIDELGLFSWFLFRGNKYKDNPIEMNMDMGLQLKKIVSKVGSVYDNFEYANMLLYSGSDEGVRLLETLSGEDFLPATTTLAKTLYFGIHAERNHTLSYEYACKAVGLGSSSARRIKLKLELKKTSVLKRGYILLVKLPLVSLNHLYRPLYRVIRYRGREVGGHDSRFFSDK